MAPPRAAPLALALALAAPRGAEGHGWMTLPPSRNGGGLDDDMNACLRDVYTNDYKNITVKNDCMWFTSSSTIPGEPTLCDPALLTTSTSIANPCSADHPRDWTRKHPWRSPGTGALPLPSPGIFFSGTLTENAALQRRSSTPAARTARPPAATRARGAR